MYFKIHIYQVKIFCLCLLFKKIYFYFFYLQRYFFKVTISNVYVNGKNGPYSIPFELMNGIGNTAVRNRNLAIIKLIGYTKPLIKVTSNCSVISQIKKKTLELT